MLRNLVCYISLNLTLTSCFPGGDFFEQEATTTESAEVGVTVLGEITSGEVSAASGLTQVIEVPEGAALEGTSLEIPVGALNVSMTVSIEEVQSPASDSTLLELGVSSADTSSVATVITNDQGIDFLAGEMAGTIQVQTGSASAGLSLLQKSTSRGMYTRYRKPDGICYDSIFSLDDGDFLTKGDAGAEYAEFKTPYFGYYQVITIENTNFTQGPTTTEWGTTLLAQKPHDGPCKVLTKSERDALDKIKPISIGSISYSLSNQILTVSANSISEAPSFCSLRVSSDSSDPINASAESARLAVNLGGNGFPLNAKSRMQCTFPDERRLSIEGFSLPAGIAKSIEMEDRLVTLTSDFDASFSTCTLDGFNTDDNTVVFSEQVSDPKSHSLDYSSVAEDVDVFVRIACTSASSQVKATPYVRLDLGINTSKPGEASGISITSANPSTTNTVSFSFVPGAAGNYSHSNIKACSDAACTTGCVDEQSVVSSPATLSSLPDGNSYICIQTENTLGLTSDFVSGATAINVDTVAPTSPSAITVTSSNPTNGNSVSFTYTAGSDANFSTNRVKACTDSDCSVLCVDEHTDLMSPETITGLAADTAYYVCVRTEDAIGSSSSWVASAATVVTDTTAPADVAAVSISEASPLNTDSFNVSYTNGSDVHLGDHKIMACTDTVCSTSCVGLSQDAASPSTVSGLLDGMTYYACVKSTDTAGNMGNWVASGNTVTTDFTPNVINVTSSNGDGYYSAGSTVSITVEFDMIVTVVNNGDIILGLETGSTDRDATYTGGTGTNTLSFDYVVQTGDETLDLDYLAISSLAANTSSISGPTGMSADLTLPSPGGANSLGANKNIQVDAVDPVINPLGAMTVTVPTLVDAMVSDNDGIATYLWSQTSGPGTITFSSTAAEDTSVSADTYGNYMVRLTVTDNAGNLVFEDLNFTWDPPPPNDVASFEPLPGFTAEGLPMTWTDGGNTSGYLLYRQGTGAGDITWSPTPGITYTTATDISGDSGYVSSSKILYVGTDLSLTDKYHLEDNKTYLYKIFAYNDQATIKYSSGVQRLSRTYPYQSISSGPSYSCATRFGRLRCWGSNSASNILGYNNAGNHVGDDEYPYILGDVNLGLEALAVAVSNHSCVLNNSGNLRCWGSNTSGQLGDGSTTNRQVSSPVDVSLDKKVIAFKTGHEGTCALTNEGTVRCWGQNNLGQLGTDSALGQVLDGSTASDAKIGATAIDISGDLNHSCVVTSAHKVRCWGENGVNGLLGLGTTASHLGDSANPITTSLSDLDLSSNVTKVYAGATHSCAITENMGLRCWGNNSKGQLGIGSTDAMGDAASEISGLQDIDLASPDGAGNPDSADQVVSLVATSNGNTCAVNTQGQLKCWGSASNGESAYGDITIYGDGNAGTEFPADRSSWLDFGEPVVAISGFANDFGFCVMTESSAIYCWGNGANGRLGHGQVNNIGDDEKATDIAPVAVWGPVQASPGSIRPDDLVNWYDASDISTLFTDSSCMTAVSNDGDAVGCWMDKSPNGGSNHITQASAAMMPSYEANEIYGHSVLKFDGVDDFMIKPSMMNGITSAHSIFSVVRFYPDGGATNYVFMQGNALDGQMTAFSTSGDDLYWTGLNADKKSSMAFKRSVDQVTLLSGTFNGGDSSGKNFFVNAGNDMQADTITNPINIPDTTDFRVGEGMGSNFQLNGQIMELIVYKAALSDSERLGIESYLRAKWQKGVDGIATNNLALHADPMKLETVKTDTNAANCNDATQTNASDGDDISCIVDRSGRGNHIGQATISARPALSTVGINGKPTIQFDGTDDELRGQATGYAGGDSPFYLQQMVNMNSVDCCPFTFGNTLASKQVWMLNPIGSSTQLNNDFNDAHIQYANTPDYTAGPVTISAGYNGNGVKAASNQDLWVNGYEQVATGAGGTSFGDALLAPDSNILIGAYFNGAAHYTGSMTETIFYDRDLSHGEISENDIYLQRKWGQNNDNAKAPGGVHHGLALWLDADDSSSVSTSTCVSATVSPADGGSPSCWKDKSGRENHLTAAGSVTYSTDSFNGRPAVQFNSGDFSLAGMQGLNGGDQPFTVFVVFDQSSNVAEANLLQFGLSGGGDTQVWAFQSGTAGQLSSNWGTSTSATTTDTPLILNAPFVGTMSYSGGGVGNKSFHQIYVNGAKEFLNSGSGTTAANISTIDLSIGRSLDGSNPLAGHIAEVVVYDRVLSDAERQAVEAYLSQKWMEEAYPRSCTGLSSGTHVIDSDGYNGPEAPESVACP